MNIYITANKQLHVVKKKLVWVIYYIKNKVKEESVGNAELLICVSDYYCI